MLSISEKTFASTVLESPKPVLVYFWAPWCGLCHFVNPLLWKLKGECGDCVRLVDVNADSNLKLAHTYRLRSLPTLLLFEQGKVTQRLEDFKAREDFYRIQSLIQAQSAIKSA